MAMLVYQRVNSGFWHGHSYAHVGIGLLKDLSDLSVWFLSNITIRGSPNDGWAWNSMNNLRNLFSLAGFKTALKHFETTNIHQPKIFTGDIPIVCCMPMLRLFPLYIPTVFRVETSGTPPWNGRRGTDQKPRERVNLASRCCTLSTILSEYQHHRSEKKSTQSNMEIRI